MSAAELQLIGKVEMQIALAESDLQLEAKLKVFLPPLLLKLSSEYAESRQAVLRIIQQIVPRINAARALKLPLESLLVQAMQPNVPLTADSTATRTYSLVFVSKGLDRIDRDESIRLIPLVLENISTFELTVSARLFHIFCRLLVAVDTPDLNNFLSILPYDKFSNDDKKYLSRTISKFLLLRETPPNPVPIPGLSIADILYFNAQAGTTFKSPLEIRVFKQVLLKFLKEGFSSQDKILPFLIASADSYSGISDSSEILFRKIPIDYEDKALIDNLVDLFVGVPGTPPVHSILQERIMRVFSKSVYITSHDKLPQITSTGLESDYPRLKQSTVAFIKWVSSNNEEKGSESYSNLRAYGSDTIMRLKNNLMSEGWPKLDTSQVKNYSSTISQRLSYYESIGSVLNTTPELFLNDSAHLEFFFQSLEYDIPESRATIQDVLSQLTVFLPMVGPGVKQRTKELAREYLLSNTDNQNIHACRYIAIKFINSVFPFEDAEARYLCLLGTSQTNRTDTIEEATKGLHPYWFNILQSSNTNLFKSTPDLLGQNTSVTFPPFSSFIKLVQSELVAQGHDSSANIFSCLDKIIEFGFRSLVMESITGKNTVIAKDEEWSVRLDKAVEVDETVRQCLLAYIDEISHNFEMDGSANPYNELVNITFQTLSGHFGRGVKTSIDMFAKLVSFSPQNVISSLSPLAPKLLEVLQNTPLTDHHSIQIAKTFGIILSHPCNTSENISQVMDTLFSERSPARKKAQILSLGYLLSRLVLRDRLDIASEQKVKELCLLLVTHLEDSSLYFAVLEAIYQLSIFGAVGPEINVSAAEYVTKIIESITPKVKKCDEKSTLTLATLSLSFKKDTTEKNENDLYPLEQLIYDTHISKQVEFTFGSGEAFTIMTAGWQSKCLARQLDITGAIVKYLPQDTSRLVVILETVLQATASTKPLLRKASCIWLLSLLQFCGHIESVKKRSNEIQIAFMRFLADKDDLIQESASRGLSLVYEIGDRELKDNLVHDLLKSFTSNKQTNVNAGLVEHDTELFEPEMLKVSDTNVSTYKDVLNLAQDVGDPSLVYKFMSLAKSSALWSSRKGMAFGLGSILSKSSLDELLTSNPRLAEKLIPRLYRYMYDPNTLVQLSMTQIWNSLVKDHTATVKNYFPIILKELLKSMGNKEWRVRQASAAGLNDLLQQSPIESYESYTEEIWNMSFRAMDDIKESVRQEGNKLAKTLATISTRLADVKSGSSEKKAKEVLDDLIPFLLGGKGLLSDSEDIKQFSLETILKLCKTGGATIKTFVPTLVNRFILMMSSLEPEAVNYLVLNADKYNIKNSEIDAKRLQSLGHSPLLEAIEKLLVLLDQSNLDEFVNKLESAIKKSVGLPSKVCGSKILVLLISKHLELFKPYGDKLFKIAISQLNDRNETVVFTYAAATGYISKIASIKEVVSLASTITEMYFEGEDERSRQIASTISESLSKYSGDKFQSVASAFLPLVFVGRYDENEAVAKTFEREWIENTSGSDSAVIVYIDEVLAFLRKYITSNKFEVRRVLGKSVSKLSTAIIDFNGLSSDLATEIFSLLVQANKGKSWEGKELMLESLVTFAIKGKSFLSLHEEYQTTIDKILIVEMRRRNKAYQQEAVKLAGSYIAEIHNNPDVISAYMEVMNSVLKDNYLDDNESDDDSSDDPDKMEIDKVKLSAKENINLEERKLSFLKNLCESFYLDVDNFEFLLFILQKLYDQFHSKLIENTWRSKVQIPDFLGKLITDHILNSAVVLPELVVLSMKKNLSQLLDLCLNLSQIENVKVRGLRLAGITFQLFEKQNETQETENLMTKIANFKDADRSSVVVMEADKVLKTMHK